MEPVLRTRALELGYGGVAAVRDLSIEVMPGEVVAIIGANGAGKTTSLLGMAGAIPAMSGSVEFNGVNQDQGLSSNARRGMGLLTDDRSIFRELTTWENLRIGRGDPKEALAFFPQLAPLRDRKAGLLSGGEQQMLALARVMAAEPKLLFADELSLGLAPIVVQPLFASLRKLADESGTAIVLVEQHVRSVLGMADIAVVLQRGTVVYYGAAGELRNNEELITRAYLSSPEEEGVPATTAVRANQ